MKFLQWLHLRLMNKYHEESDIVMQLKDILENHVIISKKISPKYIDSICTKHFIDFEMEKCPDLSFGFSEEERARLRNFALDIINGLVK